MKDVFVEWLVKKKRNFAARVLRGFLLALSILLWFLALGLGKTLLLIFAVLISIVTYFLFCLTDLEYEYIYINGDLMFDRILRKSMRKRILNVDKGEIEVVAPMTSPKVDPYKNRQWKEFVFTSGYQKDNRRIFEIYCNNGIKVVFEPNRDMIMAMKSQMPHKVTVED
jgi:hypothetical protein